MTQKPGPMASSTWSLLWVSGKCPLGTIHIYVYKYHIIIYIYLCMCACGVLSCWFDDCVQSESHSGEKTIYVYTYIYIYVYISIYLGETSKFKCCQLQDFANICKPWQQQAYQPCLRLETISQQWHEEPFFQTLL